MKFRQTLARFGRLLFREKPLVLHSHAAVVRDHRICRSVLMIDYKLPTPGQDAGSYAALQEASIMRSLGLDVSFMTQTDDPPLDVPSKFRQLGVEVLERSPGTDLLEFLSEHLARFDAVYISRFGVAEYCLPTIRRVSPSLPVLFNNADLHFLREMRSLKLAPYNAGMVRHVLDIRKRELAICESVDAVLCYTTTEHAVISSHITQALNYQLTPWVTDLQPEGPGFEEREGLMFLGNFQHKPNVEAIELLAKRIIPKLVSVKDDLRLYVYGSNLPDSLLQLQTDNLRFIGYVPDLKSAFDRHRLFVAPLMSGAGIKGKVIEAMSFGVPVVLTEIAAEGIGVVDEVSAVVVTNEDQMVQSILRAYDGEVFWSRLIENARDIVEHHYSFSKAQRDFKLIFESVGLALPKR